MVLSDYSCSIARIIWYVYLLLIIFSQINLTHKWDPYTYSLSEHGINGNGKVLHTLQSSRHDPHH